MLTTARETRHLRAAMRRRLNQASRLAEAGHLCPKVADAAVSLTPCCLSCEPIATLFAVKCGAAVSGRYFGFPWR